MTNALPNLRLCRNFLCCYFHVANFYAAIVVSLFLRRYFYAAIFVSLFFMPLYLCRYFLCRFFHVATFVSLFLCFLVMINVALLYYTLSACAHAKSHMAWCLPKLHPSLDLRRNTINLVPRPSARRGKAWKRGYPRWEWSYDC